MDNLIYLEILNGKLMNKSIGKKYFIRENDKEIVLSYENDYKDDGSLFEGVKILLGCDQICVYTDHFSSIPLFYSKTGETVYISNIFNQVASKLDQMSVDRVGFWESYLYESPLLGRTLISQIKTIQASHFLKISKNGEIIEEQYFEYKFSPTESNNFIDDANNLMNQYLNFGTRDDKSVLFPLSGGVDSRLLFVYYVSKNIKNQFKSITYGFSSYSLENKYARKLMTAKGISLEKHDFFKLDSKSYFNNIDHLIDISGGLIGMQNSHLYGYLKSNEKELKDTQGISGFFADTIFGYSTKTNEVKTYKQSKKYKILLESESQNIIDKDIKFQIEEDLYKIDEQFQKSTIENFDEFFYLKERTSKFHMQLLNLFRTVTDFHIPLYNEKLTNFFMGLPSDIKENKKIIFELLDSYFPETKHINNISSSGRFTSGRGMGMTKKNFILYIIITIINKILLNKLMIPFQFDNPYDTEKQEYYFIKNYKEKFNTSIKVANDYELYKQKDLFNIYRHSIGMRGFQLITNTGVLERFISRGKKI